MKRELLFAFVAFFLMSLIAITGAYANEKQPKIITINSNKQDVTGDGKKDLIVLKGVSLQSSKSIFSNIILEITDGNGKQENFDLNGGLEPTITFQDLDQDKIPELFIKISTDDHNKLANYTIYSYKDNEWQKLSTPPNLTIKGEFTANYIALLTVDETKQTFSIPLHNRRAQYDARGIYRNGILLQPKALIVHPYNALSIEKIKKQGYGIRSIQRISGSTKSDFIGLIQSTWIFKNGEWKVVQANLF